MMAAESQLAKIRHAYQTLNIPPEASTNAIKQAYRRLLKRWHPDLYVSGTPAHAEATQMSEHIIEAYTAIANAPLRYSGESRDRSRAKPNASSAAEYFFIPSEQARSDESTTLTIARIEYVVRFSCGAGFGLFACFLLAFYILADAHWDLPPLIPVALGITVASGFASARMGDKFWYWILQRWWLEP